MHITVHRFAHGHKDNSVDNTVFTFSIPLTCKAAQGSDRSATHTLCHTRRHQACRHTPLALHGTHECFGTMHNIRIQGILSDQSYLNSLYCARQVLCACPAWTDSQI